MANPSTFSCALLLVVLVLVSAASSTGHAQEIQVEVFGLLSRPGVENPWQAYPANAAPQCSNGGGRGGVNVTLSCPLGTDVASNVTDSRGLFAIAANVTDWQIIISFSTDKCVLTANSNCDLPGYRQLIAPVISIGKVAVSGRFRFIALESSMYTNANIS